MINGRIMFRKAGFAGLCLALWLLIISGSAAFEYKKIDDFKTLDAFGSVGEFETYYGTYIQDCIDNTGGGAGGIACLIGYDIWNREITMYYDKLMSLLDDSEKKLLKDSQLAWSNERDATIAFNSALLDIKYRDEPGTMYALLRAEEADAVIVPIVRERALLLKKWFDTAGSMKTDLRSIKDGESIE